MTLASLISAVREIIGALLRSVGIHDLAGSGAHGFARPRRSLAQQMFELRKHLLEWVEVGRIFRKQEQARADLADGVADGFRLVAAEIIRDHQIAGKQGRRQHLLDISAKPLASGRQ